MSEPPAPEPSAEEGLRERLSERLAPLRPYLPTAAFVGGFGWDSVTLSRVDELTDNGLLLTYLLALGGLLIAHARAERHPDAWPRLTPKLEWAGLAIQFLFGGLFSAYLIFYFKSATVGRTLLFLGLVIAAMLINEFWTERLELKHAWIPMYAICWFSFLLFFLPVVTGYLGAGVFSAAAAGALVAATVVALGVHWEPEPDWWRYVARPVVASGVALSGMFLLDLLRIIPPIPLALMERGIFHDVRLTSAGYELTWQDHWWPPWRRNDQPYFYRDGDRVWCFTSIFAPTDVELQIVHVWERRDEEEGWLVSDEIALSPLEGGRDDGWRTYSAKRWVEPGEWRVTVQTDAGRELGRIDFEILEDSGDERAWEARIAR